MAKRRLGTIPQRVRLTQQTVDRVDAYQEQHNIPSFSATVETLLRIGLEQSPAEVLVPIIVSTMQQEFRVQVDRLVKLLVYDIIETGIARRMAAAAVRDVGRLKNDDPDRYFKILDAAQDDARKMLARTKISKVLEEAGWKPDDPPPTD